MMKEFSRTQRIAVQIQRELADIIRKEISTPDLGMLTVSEVKVSSDLKYARVYVTLFGGRLDVEQSVAYLNNAAKLLRHHLSQRLTTRTTPRLQFIHDTSIEYASRLTALIDSVQAKEK
ncbi:MAG TPA: 30S ribosome-binding factor RbfA [Thiotrichaceae bacterium]|nr:30S ribosome-binding factor RbfA [Thiotrichaceae bacterium]